MHIDEQGKNEVSAYVLVIVVCKESIYYEGSSSSIHKSVAFIQSHYAELEALNNIPSNLLVVHPGVWSPPAVNIIKLNFDAYFIFAINKSISGIIARNSLGQIMVACAYPHTLVADPFIAEAKTCEMVVSFAFDLGFHQIQTGNEAAHKIARAAVQFDLLRYWFGTVPAVVEQVARRDLVP
ncbi:hypothetical protein V6N13_030827 [Hibiscus sabdariffa]|uniref:RNase H type-1 domain-containing protein n=1 Tax=Hibiscus sabdariffa TaxID=183260 RepID=A0ABR2D6E3_9ROSI